MLKVECIRSKFGKRINRLFGVKDTGHVTVEHCLTNLLFCIVSLVFVLCCFTSTMPSKSRNKLSFICKYFYNL